MTLLQYRDAKRLDRVIANFEVNAKRASETAAPLIDLAAAQLTAGWAQGAASRFADALDSADRALQVDPRSSRACFNRSFALEELGLLDLARQGWESCEQLEKNPEWRQEARQRAEALTQPPPTRKGSAASLDKAIRSGNRQELARWARERPHQAASFVIRNLLPRWIQPGFIDDAVWCPGLEYLAEQVRKSTGDRLLFDTVFQMRSSLAAGNGKALVEGSRQLRRGFDSYEEPDYQSAAVRFQEGGRSLGSTSPLGMVTRTYRAVSLNSAGQVAAAKTQLEQILTEAKVRSYSWPLGYAHWTLGRMAMRENHPLTALDHFHQAVEAFERVRAEDLMLSVGVMMAEVHGSLGQPESAWNSARTALLAAQRLGDTDRLFFVLNVLAGIADSQHRPSLALYAQTSAIEHSAGVSARLKANAHLWRAYYLQNLEDPDRAQKDLLQAEALSREVTSPLESATLEAELDLARGVLAAKAEPAAAVIWLGEAARLFEQAGGRINRLAALKIRADTLRRLERVDEAAADLEEAMAVYDRAARNLANEKGGSPSEPDRLSYLLQNADVYESMIDLHLRELKSPWKALILAEQAKLLTAPGRRLAPDLSGNSVDRWVRALPPATALVSYAKAEGNLVAWVLTPSARRFFPLGRAGDVADLTDRLGRATDAATWKALSRKLYSRLMSPMEEPLRGVERILIVPAAGLDRVPFAGLIDPRSGRYLVESRLLEMLPNADALVRETDTPGEMGRRRNLVVGDPKPTKAALLGLVPLRFAEEEARAAATALGAGTVLLLGSDATPDRFRKEARGAEVIHVAGHALALGHNPDSAALVLATGSGDEEGLLTAREILRLPLSGTNLVILSACSSAGGPAISWQSGLTLGRSFLSAGARQVVATLHAVDDEESARLFEVFHRELAAGNDAAISLRNAQREILQARSPSERWSPPSWPYVIILRSRPSP